MWSGFLHSSILGTFMRQPRVAPEREALMKAGVNAAFIGFPWDSTCISRTGTNLGPKALREAGDQFLLYNANTGMDLSAHFIFADVGDVPVVMGNAVITMARGEAMIAEVLASGAIPVTLGGDHSITIAGVRAFAKAVPACGLILLDTHFDTAVDVGGETLSRRCRFRSEEYRYHWHQRLDEPALRARLLPGDGDHASASGESLGNGAGCCRGESSFGRFERHEWGLFNARHRRARFQLCAGNWRANDLRHDPSRDARNSKGLGPCQYPRFRPRRGFPVMG